MKKVRTQSRRVNLGVSSRDVNSAGKAHKPDANVNSAAMLYVDTIKGVRLLALAALALAALALAATRGTRRAGSTRRYRNRRLAGSPPPWEGSLNSTGWVGSTTCQGTATFTSTTTKMAPMADGCVCTTATSNPGGAIVEKNWCGGSHDLWAVPHFFFC